MPTEDFLTPTDEISLLNSPSKREVKAKMMKFNYQHFLALLKKPESRNVVTTIRKFIESYKQDISEKFSINEQVSRYRTYRDELAESLFSHSVWIEAGEEAQLLGVEGIEYMTMNQIHNRAFCPKLSDDKERDEALDKKMAFFHWLEASHLDVSMENSIPLEVLERAASEFQRINEYKTPRDKLICLMNAIRILSKSIESQSNTANTDSLMPAVILALLKARPNSLYSNLQYIVRFRNRDSMVADISYNLTTINAAVAFIEKLDDKVLVIEKAEYDEKMADAVALYNADLLLREEEESRRHQEMMVKKEEEMLKADKAAKEEQRRLNPEPMQRSKSTELKAFLGELEDNGTKLFQKVRQSSFLKQSKDIFSDFVMEAKTAVKSLVDESDDDYETARDDASRRAREEEEYNLQLALAISLSEAENKRSGDDIGKEKIPADEAELPIENVIDDGKKNLLWAN